MYKVRVTSLDKNELMLERNVVRHRLATDQWEYWADTAGWFKTQAEAEAKAATYCERNLRVEVLWYGMKPGEERVVRLVRDIEPQHVFEARRSLNPPASKGITPLSLIKSAFTKLGTAIQALICFGIAVSPIAGPSGEQWELALIVGLGAVAIFLFGRSMGRDEGRQEAMKSLGRS
jgi:Flp pilus assembly pilin Flp